MRQYFIAIANFILCFVVLIALALPQYQDFQSRRLELSQKKADLQSQADYWKNLKKIDEELHKRQVLLEKINSGLPLDPSLPSLLGFLQQTASQEGLVLKKAELGLTTLVSENPPIKKKGVFLEVAGAYPAFRRFLTILEKSSRLIQTESLSFSLPEKGDVFSFSLDSSVNFLFESLPASQGE
ncbi:MAG: type 4a pilus biogenesis protein PilO [Candidatus Wildermuthbacteria bacterium]|nr:type 4a pilus biogenesis protein PilO [Candidatus Wildermuthbacteria bacterium]